MDHHVSASQVQRFRDCKRAWYFDSVLGLRSETPTGAQAVGTRVHLVLESRLSNRPLPEPQPPEILALADAAQQALPEVLDEPVAEEAFSLDTYPGGPAWVGYIDLHQPGRVIDFKTRSDRRYAKTSSQLIDDIQMISYAKWDLQKFPEVTMVVLQHLNILTKGKPKAWFTTAVVDRLHVNQVWAKALKDVREMEKIRAALPDAQQVPATGVTTGHCQAYRGCPHRERCGLSPASELVSLFRNSGGESNMSDMMERIKAMKERIQAGKTNPPPVNGGAVGVVPPDAPPREETPSDVYEDAKGKAEPPATEAPTEDETPRTRARTKSTPPAVEVSALQARIDELEKHLEASRKVTLKTQDQLETFQSALAEEKIQRMRCEAEALKAAQEAEEARKEAVRAVQARVTTLSEMQAEGLTIYLGVLPAKGAKPTHVQEWLAPIAEQALAQANEREKGPQAYDLRLVEYAKGAGYLAAAIRAALAVGMNPPTPLYIPADHPYAAVLGEVLTPVATTIVKGA